MNAARARELFLRNLATMPTGFRMIDPRVRWHPDLSPADPDAPKKLRSPRAQRVVTVAPFVLAGITAIFMIWNNLAY